MKLFIILICFFFCFSFGLTGCGNGTSGTLLYNSDEGFVPVLQAYVFSDYGIEYSADEVEKRILADVGFEDSSPYLVVQLPFLDGDTIRNDVDTVRVVKIEMNEEGHNVASAYTAAFALDSTTEGIDDGPYSQVTLPPVEEKLYFTATKVRDPRYGVYLPPGSERLPLNEDGIVVTSFIGDAVPDLSQLPKVIFDNPDILEGVYIVIHSASSTGITFSLKNTTKIDYDFGEPYFLYIKGNDGWEIVDYIIDNGGFVDIAYFLPAESETEILSINWAWLYGRLGGGDYKIRKEITFFRGTNDYDIYIVEQEFTIPDEHSNSE